MWLELLYMGSTAFHIGYFCALFKIKRHENCALLGCYAAGSGKKLPLVVVRNYHYQLRNNLEERSSQLLRCGSQQWRPPRLATVYQCNIINGAVLHVVQLSIDVKSPWWWPVKCRNVLLMCKWFNYRITYWHFTLRR